jgi:hypothetical protein
MRRGTITTLSASACVLSLFAAFGMILWRTDALVFTGSDPSAKVVSAVLALVGAFLAAVVSIIGLVVKHAIDIRTEERLATEAQRSAILQREAENRLSLEAAISAVQLLATQSGSPSLPIQRAGALITLSSLGQHTLTLALASELLQRNELEPSTAAVVLEHALRSGKTDVQADAMARLGDAAAQMATPNGFELPMAIVVPSTEMPLHIRRWVPLIVARVLLARPLKEWLSPQFAPSANTLLGTLCVIWETESHTSSKRDAAAILAEVLSGFPADGTIIHPAKAFEISTIRDGVGTSQPASDVGAILVEALRAWRVIEG